MVALATYATHQLAAVLLDILALTRVTRTHNGLELEPARLH